MKSPVTVYNIQTLKYPMCGQNAAKYVVLKCGWGGLPSSLHISGGHSCRTGGCWWNVEGGAWDARKRHMMDRNIAHNKELASPNATVPGWRSLSVLLSSVQLSSVQSLSRVRLFATPWTTARQASLSITNSWSSLTLTSIKSVMPSSHLILCRPLFLLSPVPPSIRVFSNESTLPMRWPKYWSFSFSISPSNEHTRDWSPLGWTGWISLQSKVLSRVFSNTTVQKRQFFSAQPSSQSNSHIHNTGTSHNHWKNHSLD